MKTLIPSLYALMVMILTIDQAIGQDQVVTISGRILDKQTEEPLPLVSVYVKDRLIGTTSNANGAFTFHIPSDLANQPVVISMIGYESIEKLSSQFVKHEKIYLTPSVIALNEVVVTDKRPTAKEIVKKAYQEIKNNYPSEPYILEGFMRDLQNEDGKYVELLECAAKFYYDRYDDGYIDVELEGVRRSYVADMHPWNEDWERKNSLIDLLEDDFIRYDYGPIKGNKGWKYEIESVLPYDNRYVYKINAVNKPNSSAILHIDVDSFAFVRIELTNSMNNGKYYKRRLTNGQQEAHYNIIHEYQKHKGKMYLKYQKEEDTWQIFNGLESKELLFTKYPKKELFINKVVVENIDAYPFTKNHQANQSIESQAKPYDATFWEHYNAPAQTEQQSKIVEYLRQAQTKAPEE